MLAPKYLLTYCAPTSWLNIVPRIHRSTFGARAFAIVGPTVWNSLPDSLRDPAVGPDQFRRDLKTRLFEWHCVSFSALAVSSRNAIQINILLTYLLLLTIRHCKSPMSSLCQLSWAHHPTALRSKFGLKLAACSFQGSNAELWQLQNCTENSLFKRLTLR